MNRQSNLMRIAVLLTLAALILAACQTAAAPTAAPAAPTNAPAAPTSAPAQPAAATCTTMTPVKLQLQWVTQSQFAGYYAAKDKGFYKDECLDVQILTGAVDIVPQQVLASGQADFALAWVPKALVSREQGGAGSQEGPHDHSAAFRYVAAAQS